MQEKVVIARAARGAQQSASWRLVGPALALSLALAGCADDGPGEGGGAPGGERDVGAVEPGSWEDEASRAGPLSDPDAERVVLLEFAHGPGGALGLASATQVAYARGAPGRRPQARLAAGGPYAAVAVGAGGRELERAPFGFAAKFIANVGGGGHDVFYDEGAARALGAQVALGVPEGTELVRALDASGSVVFEIGAPELAAVARAPAALGAEGVRRSGLGFSPGACRHVRMVEFPIAGAANPSSPSAALAPPAAIGSYRIAPLEWTDPSARDVARAVAWALGRLTPTLCSGIKRVALAEISSLSDTSNNATRGPQFLVSALPGAGGDLVIVNLPSVRKFLVERAKLDRADPSLVDASGGWRTRALALFASKIAHEAAHGIAHASWALGPAAGPSPPSGQWGPVQLAEIDRWRARHRLYPDWKTSWARMHRNAASQQAPDLGWPLPMATPYGQAVLDRKNPVTRQMKEDHPLQVYGGVPSPVALDSPEEDQAEVVAGAYEFAMLSALSDPRDPEGAGAMCLAYRTHGPLAGGGVPIYLATLTHKIGWVADLGLVERADAEACTRGMAPDGPPEGAPIGWHVEQAPRSMGQTASLYQLDSVASIGTKMAPPGLPRDADGVYFQARAEGEASVGGKPHPAAFDLKIKLADAGVPLDRVGFPRGVVTFANDPGQALTFELLGPSPPSAQRFYSSKGAAYFHRMSQDLIWIRVVVTEGAYTDVPFFTTIDPEALPKRTFSPPLALTFLARSTTAMAGP